MLEIWTDIITPPAKYSSTFSKLCVILLPAVIYVRPRLEISEIYFCGKFHFVLFVRSGMTAISYGTRPSTAKSRTSGCRPLSSGSPTSSCTTGQTRARNQRFSDLVFKVERKFSVYITYNDLLSANMDILTPGAINNCINNNIYDNNRDVVLYTFT